MIKSMTAYGRAERATPFGQWVVEIHSVNRKMLDMAIYLPKELLRFDKEIRNWVGSSVFRGQLTIRVYLSIEGLFHSSLSLLKELKSFWEKMALELGFDPKEALSLRFLTEQMRTAPQVTALQDETAIGEILKELIFDALKEIDGMKKKEGDYLRRDIDQRLHLIEASLGRVSHSSSDAVQRYRQKLEDRLRSFSLPAEELEGRLLQEVVIFADKLDITEEITRLHSHIKQFLSRLQADEKSVGRTLDFIAQEMNREINTLGSKSADSLISEEVIKMKSELEKIREQVQNIE
jgi:uncharacterized protein (TIGR00255 family)